MKIFKRLLLASVITMVVATSVNAQVSIGVSISARIAPPALPEYVQPACPADGYLWVPGYWAWNNDIQDYYWVPGVWVAPPTEGLLWTPPYWGFENGAYLFHAGYWGPHVGFYGGINYGYGYNGVGFVGGRWSGNRFRYNTAVMNVNRRVVRNTYVDRTVIVNNNRTMNRTSYNGPNGIAARPTNEEVNSMREEHRDVTDIQHTHEQNARVDTRQFNANNHGTPKNISMDKVNGNHYNSGGHRLQYNAAPGRKH